MAPSREHSIAASLQAALLANDTPAAKAKAKRLAKETKPRPKPSNPNKKSVRNPRIGIFFRLKQLLWIHQITLSRIQPGLFESLRREWGIDEDAYLSSFASESTEGDDAALQSKGDMGFSGSTFYQTHDGAYIIKSVPRHFEHSFFKRVLLPSYAEHLVQNEDTVLTKITDFLHCSAWSVGYALGLAPSHHIVMENLLQSQPDNNSSLDENEKWETFDLKPTSYFYPERDIASGALTSDETKAKLADAFPHTIHLRASDAKAFYAQVEADTGLLERTRAVDYSLMIVRIPLATAPDTEGATEQSPRASPRNIGRTLDDAQEPFMYRVAIVDFFFHAQSANAKALTAVIKGWNLVTEGGEASEERGELQEAHEAERKGDSQAASGESRSRGGKGSEEGSKLKGKGKKKQEDEDEDEGEGAGGMAGMEGKGHGQPMSVTTTPDEYRKRFLSMVEGIIGVERDGR